MNKEEKKIISSGKLMNNNNKWAHSWVSYNDFNNALQIFPYNRNKMYLPNDPYWVSPSGGSIFTTCKKLLKRFALIGLKISKHERCTAVVGLSVYYLIFPESFKSSIVCFAAYRTDSFNSTRRSRLNAYFVFYRYANFKRAKVSFLRVSHASCIFLLSVYHMSRN